MIKLPYLVFALCILTPVWVRAQTDSLLNELNKHPEEDTARYLLLKRLAYEYSFTDANKGVEAADAAIALAKKLNSTVKVAGGYSNKATNLHKLGRDSEALALYRIAVNMHLSANNKKGAANAYFNMAYVYFDLGNYAMAVNYQLKALELYKELDLVPDVADTYNSIANSYMRLDDYPAALRNYIQALNIYHRLNMPAFEALVLSNIGMTYHALSDSAKAFEYYQKALRIDEQMGNKANLAHDYEHIGVLYDDARMYNEALSYYQKALTLNKEINDKRNIAGTLGNIAIIYSNLNDYSSAYENLNNALNIYAVLTDNYNIAGLLNEKGKIYADCPASFLDQQNIKITDRYSTALQFQHQALQLAKGTRSYSLAAQILEDISQTHEKDNDFQKALTTYKQAVALRDTIFTDDQKKQITRLEMQYEFNKKEDSVKAVNDKRQALAAAATQKQRIVKNSVMAGACLLLLAGVAGFIVYKRNRDIKTQKNEAELKAKVSDTEMKALRAQMNPHFIFNSLNSIVDYIDKNQAQTASDFTVKFAKLMRMVLENSQHKQVPLADDLKALELYIQLEQFRLKNKFDYIIEVDETLNKENTLIPPLILQPFVENSIWHGIAKKEGHGNITIHIEQAGQMINCIVEDDGVGIPGNNITGEEKKPLGMRITKERIDIINQLKNSNASVHISNTGKGVKAEVKLPLELSF